MNERVKYWIDMAQYDLDTAEAMLQTKRYLYVGFMCHQVIEKSIKAVIAEKNIFPPKSHNLMMLSEKAEIIEDLTEKQLDFLTLVNPLNIEARYPSYKGDVQSLLDDKLCEEIFAETKEWFSWIKSKL